MPNPLTRPVLAFVPDALTASQVGTWETNPITDNTVSDAATAAIFGVDPGQAARGLPLSAYTKAVHLQDRGALHDTLRRLREHGGLFVIEYRTLPTPDDFRWVLARGRYERDERTGIMIGRGIVIDITASKLDGRTEDRAFFLVEEEDETPLDRAAALTIQARQAIDQVAGSEGLGLRRLVDVLLLALGRALARRTSILDRGPPQQLS